MYVWQRLLQVEPITRKGGVRKAHQVATKRKDPHSLAGLFLFTCRYVVFSPVPP